ncbi:MAG: hypothetical protein MSG64_02365 [Pyrinomonadaceae bacterium MAG19_C2-C3]|nr:hypothetical protein [Pyrinomonadaceae bacterium MAG19_C2-C3]
MTGMTLHQPDFETEISELLRLENALSARREELATLQDEMRQFRERYVEIVGERLAELAEVERRIAAIEKLASPDDETQATDEVDNDFFSQRTPKENSSVRKLFWSIAKLFHPDFAGDDTDERERRHAIMAEASCAYQEGDAERLTALLSDDAFLSSCVSTSSETDDEMTLARRLSRVREQLGTVEYGIRRIKQDGFYQMKIRVDDDAARGRDALAEMAARINKNIFQARLKLDQFG